MPYRFDFGHVADIDYDTGIETRTRNVQARGELTGPRTPLTYQSIVVAALMEAGRQDLGIAWAQGRARRLPDGPDRDLIAKAEYLGILGVGAAATAKQGIVETWVAPDPAGLSASPAPRR